VILQVLTRLRPGITMMLSVMRAAASC